MRKVALLLAVLALPLGVALGQESDPQAIIEFTAPTEFTDGTPIPAGTVITYDVMQGEGEGSVKSSIGIISETRQTITAGLEVGKLYCWQVVAIVDGRRSAPSNEACKSFRVPKSVIITVR
jgi:hypothetical protein